MEEVRSTVVYELPYTPSINHYWRRVGDRTLISRTGRLFRKRVVDQLAYQGVEATDGRVGLFISVFPPDRRRRDLDNILKALLDALQHGGVYQDDSQIDSIEIVRSDAEPPDGKVLVMVMERNA